MRARARAREGRGEHACERVREKCEKRERASVGKEEKDCMRLLGNQGKLSIYDYGTGGDHRVLSRGIR